MIRYFLGDATFPVGEGPKVIAHICNDIGVWGAGFSGALSRRYSMAEFAYRNWFKAPRLGLEGKQADFDDLVPGPTLGAVQYVLLRSGDPVLLAANMIAQKGVRRDIMDAAPIHYAALRQCLYRLGVDVRNHGASVHMPRIGTGLAGGDWKAIEPLLEEALDGVDVIVYDLPKEKPWTQNV